MNTENQFIYVLKPARLGMLTAGPTPAEDETMRHHVAYLEKLAREDVVILAGRTQDATDQSFGIVILRAPSQEAAGTIMKEDPGVRDGVLTARLHPYRIAVKGIL